MKLIIEIPDEDYKLYAYDEWNLPLGLVDALQNGKPLPKGHGRLIDADYLKDVLLLHNFHGNNKNIVPYSDRKGYRLRQSEVDYAIINAPTVIEADKEDAE